MAYEVEFTPRAARDFRALPHEVRAPLRPRIDALVGNPRPRGAERLAGAEDLYRIRVGAYRIVYEVRDRVLLVVLVRIGHRREVYRRK